MSGFELPKELKDKYSNDTKESLDFAFSHLLTETKKNLNNKFLNLPKRRYGLPSSSWDSYPELDPDRYLSEVFKEMPQMREINEGTVVFKEDYKCFEELEDEDIIHLDVDDPIWFDENSNRYILDVSNSYKTFYTKANYLHINHDRQISGDGIGVDIIRFVYEDSKSERHSVNDIDDLVEKIETISLSDFLVELYGEELYDQLCDYSDNLRKQLSHLKELSLSNLRKKDTQLFNGALLDKVFVQLERNEFTDKEKSIIKNQLSRSSESGKIFRLLYTLTYTTNIFKQEEELNDFLDLTFITVSAFKVVEVVFNELLKKHFKHLSIVDSNGKEISFSNPKLTIGNMQQFFYLKDNDVVLFLEKTKERSDKTLKLLDKWRDKSRNGYLHKDIIEVKNKNQLRESVSDSVSLLGNIVLMFNELEDN